MRSGMVGLVAVGVLALGAVGGSGPAAAASPVSPLRTVTPLHAARSAQEVVVRSTAGARLLYNQDNDRSGQYWWSSDWPQKSLKAHDSQLANQFTVPKGDTWAINEVVAPGIYWDGTGGPGGHGGPAASENVYLYKNTVTASKRNVPGALINKQTVKGHDYGAGLLVIPGISGVSLSAGRYWISVQATMPSAQAGRWGWYLRDSTTSAKSLWENPGGGYGYKCASWAKDCALPSVAFALYGSGKS